MFSSLPLSAVDNSHIKGNMDNSDTVISVRCTKNPLVNFVFELLKFFIFSFFRPDSPTTDTACFQTA